MEARLVLDTDGMDENLAIFDDWSDTNPSPRTFMSQLFSKDLVPRPIVDSKKDNPSSSITVEFEKKIPAISFQAEEKKMGLNCSSDFPSELLGSNVQKSCLRDVRSKRMVAKARLNLLKVNESQSDDKNIMSEANSSQNETKSFKSSLAGESSSCILHFSRVVSTIDQEWTLPNNNASLQENVKLLESSDRKETTDDIVADQKASHSLSVNEIPPPLQPLDDYQNGETDLELEFSSVPENDPTKDGYNWRKYGQKQLKGCQFPCSYHKCSHPNCPAKKKVERSVEGHITEIVYKGYHNHPKPPPDYRSSDPSSKQFHVPQTDSSDHPGSAANFKENYSLASAQDGFTGPQGSDDLGGSSPCDPSNFLKRSRLELEAMDASCPIFNYKEENGEHHGSFFEECDIEEEEMETKRRKQELCYFERRHTSRFVGNSRIAVQIPCEVDLPDDGYRWRKYGQKVVKGNPNPRSYYKCTQRGCSVRKHVERASDDQKSVISTYEGRHNHNVPSARNINQSKLPPPNPTAGLHLPSLYSRPDLALDSFTRLENCAPMSAADLLNRRPQLGSPTSFSFSCGDSIIDQSNLAILCPSSLSSMEAFKTPFFSQMHQQMDQQINVGNVMPKI